MAAVCAIFVVSGLVKDVVAVFESGVAVELPTGVFAVSERDGMMRDDVASTSGELVLRRLVVEVMNVVGKIGLLARRVTLKSEVRSEETTTLKQEGSVQLDDRDDATLGLVEGAAVFGVIDCPVVKGGGVENRLDIIN